MLISHEITQKSKTRAYYVTKYQNGYLLSIDNTIYYIEESVTKIYEDQNNLTKFIVKILKLQIGFRAIFNNDSNIEFENFESFKE